MPFSQDLTQLSIRERLTLAALAEAEAFGFEGFSMRRVARACGVSCAAPYKHFKNKNEILESVISYINEKWLERQEKTIARFADAPLRRQLIELSREYVRFMVENPRFLAVWTAKGKTGGVDYLPIKAKTSELSKALLRQYCDEFGVSEETARAKMYVVRSLIYGAALMFCNGDLEYDENALQFVADFVDREFDLA
ncbi:MAG: TetR/AcrR family transcriptional regulator [Thermoguttaceae bacterium]|nr:TetR/AcrR family transcriptional regulator [Thermoguttaceae bacterium]